MAHPRLPWLLALLRVVSCAPPYYANNLYPQAPEYNNLTGVMVDDDGPYCPDLLKAFQSPETTNQVVPVYTSPLGASKDVGKLPPPEDTMGWKLLAKTDDGMLPFAG